MNFNALFDNPPMDLAIGGAIAAGLLLSAALVVSYVRRRLRNAPETPGDLDDFILDAVQRTSVLLLVFPSLYAASSMIRLASGTVAMLQTLARLSLIAQSALWAGAMIDFFLRRYHRRRVETDPAAVTTIRAFRFAALSAAWLVAILVALDNLGVDVTALVTGLGIGGVAIALATQNILGDLFASLSIVLDKPFVVGEFIRSGDQLGTVEQIGLKTTRVRSLSGELLVLSNNDLLQSRIRNYSRMAERRVVFSVGVVYQTEPDTLERIPAMVRGIIESAGPTRVDRAHFSAFGASSYDFEFVYFVLAPDYNTYMDVQQRVNLGIVRAFRNEGIDFAFPTRTLFIHGQAETPSAAA